MGGEGEGSPDTMEMKLYLAPTKQFSAKHHLTGHLTSDAIKKKKGAVG